MLVRTRTTISVLLFAITCLTVSPTRCDEYTQTKTFHKPPDQVFLAAQEIVRRYGLATILEADQQRHILRLRLNESKGWRMNESYSASYGVFTVEPASTKTKARLVVGKVDTRNPPPYPAMVSPPLRDFSKRFFRLLKEELHI